MAAIPFYFPLDNDPEGEVCYLPMVYEDTMTFVSGYRATTQSHEGDLYKMFTMVPYQLWIGYFVTFVTFVTLLLVGSKLLKEKYPSTWLTICAFLDQDNFPTTSR